MAKQQFPRMQSKDGKHSRQPSTAAAFHQLQYDGWRAVDEKDDKDDKKAGSQSASSTTSQAKQ